MPQITQTAMAVSDASTSTIRRGSQPLNADRNAAISSGNTTGSGTSCKPSICILTAEPINLVWVDFSAVLVKPHDQRQEQGDNCSFDYDVR